MLDITPEEASDLMYRLFLETSRTVQVYNETGVAPDGGIQRYAAINCEIMENLLAKTGLPETNY